MNSKTEQAKSVSLSLSDIRGLADEPLLLATIAEVKKTGDQLSRFLVYAGEARRRFDNRGRGTRVIAGYRGWEDFVTRGLEKNIRTFQRRLAEFNDPAKAEERRKKDRERDEVHKIYARTEAQIHAANRTIMDSYRSTQKIIQAYVEQVPPPDPVTLVPVIVEKPPQEDYMLVPVVYREPPVGLYKVTRNGMPLQGPATAPAPERVERIFLAVKESEIGVSSEVFAVYTDAPSNSAAAETAEKNSKGKQSRIIWRAFLQAATEMSHDSCKAAVFSVAACPESFASFTARRYF